MPCASHLQQAWLMNYPCYSCMAPAEDFLDEGQPDEPFLQLQGEDFMSEEFLNNLVMETTDMVKGSIQGCAFLGHPRVNVGMESDAATTPRLRSRPFCCAQVLNKCSHRKKAE